MTDCSKPFRLSVNNYVNEVCNKFSYKGVDTVMEFLQQRDFLGIIDIKNV